MTTPEDDDDWTSGVPIALPIALPMAQLKQKGHDLFDPIWREDRLLTRSQAYEMLAAALGIPEPQAHFSTMTRHTMAQAVAILPELRERLKLYQAAIRRADFAARRRS